MLVKLNNQNRMKYSIDIGAEHELSNIFGQTGRGARALFDGGTHAYILY